MNKIKDAIMKFQFMSVGRTNKLNRELWLEKKLSKIPPDLRILDAGAGESQYKKFCKHLEYVSQDFGRYDGIGDNAGLQTETWDNSKLDLISDITNIPVVDSSLDAIMCIEVFEHIPEPISAIKEFARILRPGGVLILTSPVCSLTHFAPYYFYNGYSRYFYDKFLKEYGFEIEELSFNGNWFEYIAQELHRLPYILNRHSGFGGKIFKYFLEFLLIPLYVLLSKASANDSGSNEMLSFGIHIKARKL